MVGAGNANKIHLVSMLAEGNGVRSEEEREEGGTGKHRRISCRLPLTSTCGHRLYSLIWFFLCLRNSRGGLLCGTIKPLRIRQDIKDTQSVVGKCDKRQQDMAAIMVSYTSVILCYLITFYLCPGLSNILFHNSLRFENRNIEASSVGHLIKLN
jgi:hypothetical protein